MSNDRLNRVALTERLATVGFPYEDARAWVARLPDEQVSHELLWHDREAQWFAAGPPASWSPAQKAEANDHYLRAHFVDPVWMLTTYGRQQALDAPPPPPKSNTGVVVAGLAFVGIVGLAAWIAGRK